MSYKLHIDLCGQYSTLAPSPCIQSQGCHCTDRTWNLALGKYTLFLCRKAQGKCREFYLFQNVATMSMFR